MRRRDVPCSPCGSGSSDCGCCPPKSIKKINNIEPDDNGKFEVRAGTNVTITDITNGIEISSAGSAEDVVKSVNGVSPDADGEVTITAGSNITITPDAETNSIEISASGGTPTAKTPIYIDNDGDICFKDWKVYDNTDWTGIIDSTTGVIKQDLLVVVVGNNNGQMSTRYLPEGLSIKHPMVNVIRKFFFDQVYTLGQGVLLTNISNGNGSDDLNGWLTTTRFRANYLTVIPSSSGSDANSIITFKSQNDTQGVYIYKRTSSNIDDDGIYMLVRE